MSADTDRRSLALAMRHAGQTYEQIGRSLGVSRQRAHQLCSEAQGKPPRRRMSKIERSLLTIVDRYRDDFA